MVNPFGEAEGGTDCSKWTTAGSGISCDGVLDRILINTLPNGVNNTTARDLTDVSALAIPISDTSWRLRVLLHWQIFNSFRNTDPLFESQNLMQFGLSDSDQTVNALDQPELFVGALINNFDGNSPTPLIRAGGSPVPPFGFRGLLSGRVKDGVTTTDTGQFTPGGQPGSQSITHIEIERVGALMTIGIFTDATFTPPAIESKNLAIPASVVGLKFIKFGNFTIVSNNNSAIDGHVASYELLTAEAPEPPTFGTTSSLYSKLHGGE